MGYVATALIKILEEAVAAELQLHGGVKKRKGVVAQNMLFAKDMVARQLSCSSTVAARETCGESHVGTERERLREMLSPWWSDWRY